MRKQHEVELRQLREEQENRLSAMDDVRRKKESDFQDMRKKYEEEKVRIEKTAADSERRLQEKILLLVEELRRIRERLESFLLRYAFLRWFLTRVRHSKFIS